MRCEWTLSLVGRRPPSWNVVSAVNVNHSARRSHPRCLPSRNNLRVSSSTGCDLLTPFWRLSLPYYLQLEERRQTVQFGPMLTRLQDLRKVTRRQLRDATRAARREAKMADQPDVATQARRYADTLARNPALTKSQLARDLGISRVRLFQVLNLLKLPDPVLDYIAAHDSSEHKAILTERRLRSLTQADTEAEQLAQFRELLDCAAF